MPSDNPFDFNDAPRRKAPRRKDKVGKERPRKPIRWPLRFLCVVLGWIVLVMIRVVPIERYIVSLIGQNIVKNSDYSNAGIWTSFAVECACGFGFDISVVLGLWCLTYLIWPRGK